MAQWATFPWKEPLFTNADETILRIAPAAAENCYANAAGGFSRFPGLKPFVSLPDAGRVYLKYARGSLLAVTDAGRVYRVDAGGVARESGGPRLTVRARPTFAVTDDMVLMAAGGEVLQLGSTETKTLNNAGTTTHIAYLDGYLIASEMGSGRFRFSNPGEPTVWPPLSFMTAEGKPDDIIALAVSPQRELLLCGEETVELWETLANGDNPFTRRYPTGEGLAYPHTLVTNSDGNYGVNPQREFVEYSGRMTEEKSRNVALTLEMIDDWTDAWADTISIQGQRFIILQAPNASVPYYGTKGVTLLLDYRNKRWSFLWGWDDDVAQPARWPGWSTERAWGRTFVGVEGGIAELDGRTFTNLGKTQRMLIRSAHVDDFGPSRVDGVRLRMKRGLGEDEGRLPQLSMRMWRDNKARTKMITRNFGRPGDDVMNIEFGGCGAASGTWQMEVIITDPVQAEFVGARILVERLGW